MLTSLAWNPINFDPSQHVLKFGKEFIMHMMKNKLKKKLCFEIFLSQNKLIIATTKEYQTPSILYDSMNLIQVFRS